MSQLREEAWRERVAAASKLGLCVGALKGLIPQVPNDIRPKIQSIIDDVGEYSVSPGNENQSAAQVKENCPWKCRNCSHMNSCDDPRCEKCGQSPPASSTEDVTGEEWHARKSRVDENSWVVCDQLTAVPGSGFHCEGIAKAFELYHNSSVSRLQERIKKLTDALGKVQAQEISTGEPSKLETQET